MASFTLVTRGIPQDERRRGAASSGARKTLHCVVARTWLAGVGGSRGSEAWLSEGTSAAGKSGGEDLISRRPPCTPRGVGSEGGGVDAWPQSEQRSEQCGSHAAGAWLTLLLVVTPMQLLLLLMLLFLLIELMLTLPLLQVEEFYKTDIAWYGRTKSIGAVPLALLCAAATSATIV